MRVRLIAGAAVLAAAVAAEPALGDLSAWVEPLQSRIVDQRLKLATVETGRATVLALSADVLFAFDSARVRTAGMPALDRVAERIEAAPRRCVDVVGHTDARGSTAYNDRLSGRAANRRVEVRLRHRP